MYPAQTTTFVSVAGDVEKSVHRRTNFVYRVVCKYGVLVEGWTPDFLIAVESAKQEKERFSSLLPNSTLRVNLFYPNGKRVALDDIKAALHSLADRKVHTAVLNRIVAATGAPPAAQARTERTVGAAFCQAGVVAPPDSLTGETSHISSPVEFNS